MYFTDEKDYIMRMIKEMVRVLFSLMFGKKYVSVELEKENKYEVSGKNLKDFLDMLGIILGFLVMFYGIISNNNVFIIGIGIIVMGIDVVLLPFTTPETINFLGYKKSKFAGRISGILLIVVGVWMWFIQ